MCHKCNKAFPPIPNPNAVRAASASDGSKNEANVVSPASEGKEASAGEEGTKELKCERCSHQFCDSCPRARPVKVDPGLHPGVDEDVLERVRRRLAGLGVDDGKVKES